VSAGPTAPGGAAGGGPTAPGSGGGSGLGKIARGFGHASLPVKIAVIAASVAVLGGVTYAVASSGGSDDPKAAATTGPPTVAPTTAVVTTTAPTTAPPTTGQTTAATTAPTTGTTTGATTAPTTGPPVGLAGSWDGVWKSSRFPINGTFQMTVTVTNGKLHGTITVHSPGGTATSKVTGTAKGDDISFGAIKGAPITFTGKVVGNRSFGTYKSTDGSGDHGTWSSNRVQG
jgi:hypothetical protein